jgi:7-cyano-7-deazaguanine reductase
MSENIYQDLEQLGGATVLPDTPETAILESVKNPQADVDYMIRFTAPEFTSLCPMTSQPDFAHLVIDYIPDQLLVESKSLKLFLGSFRNHGAFHEDCTVSIARRLIEEIKPKWIRIGGYWYPRGGIPIDVFFAQGEIPKGVWVPEQGVAGYRGRG